MLATVDEDSQAAGGGIVDREGMNENVTGGGSRRRSVSNTARSLMSRFSETSRDPQGPEYESDVVDLLDVLGKSTTIGLPRDAILTCALQIPKSRL
jgi:hypothetical protein